jgi:arylsulfatase A-like enzyme
MTDAGKKAPQEQGKLMCRRVLLGSAAAASAMTVLSPGLAAGLRKPNIILVCCDDLGYGDIGPYGNTVIPTPNLDKFAREGVRLTNYYAAGNVSVPSYAGMLTGRYAIHTGMNKTGPWGSPEGLPLSNPTIPKTLRTKDYVCALVGKWGLGETGQYWPPTVQGYDYFYGIPHSHDTWPLAVFEARAGSAQVSKADVSLSVDVTPNVTTLQEDFYRRGERFIVENASRPFYINFNFSAPHLPSSPPAEFVGRSQAGDYGDTVVQLDSFVGRLMAKLQQLNLHDDTVVVFTSDNGPWYWGSAGALRDRKTQPGYDGAYKVPFLARYPRVIPPGVEVDAIMDGVDLYPTFASLAGVPVPASADIDGLDMTPVLTRHGKSPRDELVLFQEEDVVGIRTQRWKYLRNRGYSPVQPRASDYDYRELYDMRDDVSESYNVHTMYPEVEKEMSARFERARQRFDPMRSRPAVKPALIRFIGDGRQWPDDKIGRMPRPPNDVR